MKEFTQEQIVGINEAYRFYKLLPYVSRTKVPKHIINHSPNYKYPHDYPNSYVKQQYLPDEIKGAIYYNPKNNKNENLLRNIMEKLKNID